MLTCIPTNGGGGLEDTLSDHFGSAPFFTLYDSETGTLNIVKNRNAHHSHGTCHPMTQLAKYRIDSIICSGIGRRAIEMLNNEGIRVYASDRKTVADVVEQIKADDLTEADPTKACKGHGQRQGIIHGPSYTADRRGGGGQGRGARRRRPQRRG